MTPSARRAAPHRSLPLRASGDRWLFGYADIVTLMFACFATLYAVRVEPVAAAPPAAPVSAPAQPSAPPEVEAAPPKVDRAESVAITAALADLLKPAGDVPAIEIGDSARGVVISLPEAGSFPAGRADLTD